MFVSVYELFEMLIQPLRVTFTGSEENKLEGDIYGDSGRVVLLLHGGGQTRYAWRAAATRLAERGFIAIAADQRGHGSSAWIESGAYIRIDPALIESFGRTMRENLTTGSTPFRKAYLRALIDVIEVDGAQIRIKGSKDVLEKAVLASRMGAEPHSQMKWRAAPGDDDNYNYAIAL